MAVTNPIERFERWRRRQVARTANLAQRVVDELVPLYESNGFQRFEDYAGGNLSVVAPGTIALQRRSGEQWPTIELQFHPRGRASFNITFASLPQVCYRRTTGSPHAIHRKLANVVEGNEYFSLCKGSQQDFDCTYGVPLFAIFADRRLAQDFELAKYRSQFLVEIFNAGIPTDWIASPGGYVSEFVFMVKNSR